MPDGCTVSRADLLVACTESRDYLPVGCIVGCIVSKGYLLVECTESRVYYTESGKTLACLLAEFVKMKVCSLAW